MKQKVNKDIGIVGKDISLSYAELQRLKTIATSINDEITAFRQKWTKVNYVKISDSQEYLDVIIKWVFNVTKEIESLQSIDVELKGGTR